MTTDSVAISKTVKVDNLVKRFGKFTAVDDISFDVNKGEIFGFLGPNGAGKSTTIRMLCGIIKPTSGDGYVGGYSIKDQNDNIKLISGYMSQKFSLYGDLSPWENLEFYSGAYGLSGSEKVDRINWALNMSGLEDRKDDLTANLSVGYKQRLALGASLLHQPSILFLDEPTAGVDPVSRRDFWDLIYKLSSDGVTIFVTTHYMDEAEHCDRIAFIDKGKLIKLDSPTALKQYSGSDRIYELQVKEWFQAFNLLRAKSDQIGDISLFGTKIHIDLKFENVAVINSILSEENIPIISFNKIQPSLEDVFVSLLKPDIESESE